MVCCHHVLGQECYKQTRQRGIELYNSGKKESAQKAFQAAQSCPDKPANNDLNIWISKCKKNEKQKVAEQKQKPEQKKELVSCYVGNYNKGIELFYKGKKAEAKIYFVVASSCPDKPKFNILDKLIQDCEESVAAKPIATPTDKPVTAPAGRPALRVEVQPGSVTLPAGTSVYLKSNYAVYAKKAKRNSNVYFSVNADVVVEGRTVIPKGSTAIGFVRKAKRSSAFGTKGKLHIEMSHIAIGDKIIELDYKVLNFYGKNNTPIAVAAGILFPPCFFITGTKAYMPDDYEFVVKTSYNVNFESSPSKATESEPVRQGSWDEQGPDTL